jgi:hypothetical protein
LAFFRAIGLNLKPVSGQAESATHRDRAVCAESGERLGAGDRMFPRHSASAEAGEKNARCHG